MQRVERAFRPGQVARARLTITNDGDIPMRYAVEVSPGVTAPVVGFVAEEISVLVTDLVQPGRSVTVRVPLSLPPEVAEGRKVVRVRIGEAGPEGDLLDILDEEFFSGLLRVEVPRPEAPPPVLPAPTPPLPVEAIPLPGEIPRVRGRIVSVESPQRGQALQGGQRATIRATYENTGAEPHAFSVIAWAGEVTGPGQIDPDVQGTARGPTVNPGARNTLEVSLSLPEQPPLGFGSKDALVMLVDLDPTGRFPVSIHDSRGLPDLFTLAAPPTPPEVVTPAPGEIVTPRPLAFGDIRIDRVTASPATAGPGDLITFTLPFANLSPVPAPLRIEPAIIDRAGSSVVDIAPAAVDLPVGRREPGLEFRVTLPAGIQPGSYGLGVDILDRTTNVLLAQRDFPGLFSVAAPVLPAPAGLLPGDLDLLDPVVEPAVINPGQTVQVQLPFFNAGPIAPPVTADVFILGPQGTAVATLPRLTFSPELGAATLRTVRWTVPQAAQPGSYGVQVFAWDLNTFVPGNPSTYLIREQVLDVFTVEAIPVEVAPPEIAPPGPPVPSPGDLGQPTVQFSPGTVQIGQSTRAQVSIPNLAEFSFPALVDLDLNDPSGQLVRGLVRNMELTFRPMEPSSLSFDLSTADLMPGSYGVRLAARDPSGRLLLARDLPGILNVTIPAALRGVNEFRDVKFLYDGVIEPPDPGLLARLILRQPRAPRIPKTEGAPTGGAMLAVHFGEGGRFSVGYGIAQGVTGLRGLLPKSRHNEPHIFIRTPEEIPPHAVPTPIAVFIEGRGWPNEAVFPRDNTYDALKFIDNEATGETIYQNWDDDVFEVPG